MSTFFVPSENIRYDAERPVSAELSGGDVKHIRTVLRMSVGDPLVLCDSRGLVYRCEIREMTPERIAAGILAVTEPAKRRQIPVYLFQGVPKGDKMDLIVQKGVELGVNGFFPLLTERTVVKFHAEADAEKKRERWQRIAAEAAKQCGRGAAPEVQRPIPIGRIPEKMKQPPFERALKIIPYENERDTTLKAVLQSHQALFRDVCGDGRDGKVGEEDGIPPICLMIGPEGGFSVSEVETAKEAGFLPVSLGSRILRTETAGFAAVAAIRYEFED